MSENVKQYLGRAVRLLLKPVVRMLISQGISHKDFSKAAEEVFVEIAIRHFGNSGDVDRSRIAQLTGLSEAEVNEVIKRVLAEEAYKAQLTRPSKVLSEWHTDPDYTGPYGYPLEIPYDAPRGTPSFMSLVAKVAPDRQPEELLKELVDDGAVLRTENDYLKAQRRYFIAKTLSPDLIKRYGEFARHVLSSMTINIYDEQREVTGPFERTVTSNDELSLEESRDLREYLRDKGQLFLEDTDLRLTSRKKKERQPGELIYESGVSLIQYTDTTPEDKGTLRELLIERKAGIGSKLA